MIDKTLVEQVHAVIGKHPRWGRNQIAAHLGVKAHTVRSILKDIAARAGGPEGQGVEDPFKEGELRVSSSPSQSVLETRSKNIRTLEQLLAYAEFDPAEWEVLRVTINKWEVGSKAPSGEIVTAPLFQIKAWLKPLIAIVGARNLLLSTLALFKEAAPKVPRIKHPKTAKALLLEVSIFDVHLGKLCWGKESGIDYDSKISGHLFQEAVEGLLRSAESSSIGRVLFPVGNDFFNVDNALQTTTAGTRQDEDSRWQRSFALGRKLMVEAIDRLREVAPVDIVMVSGNHDTERVYYLGDVLAAWFRNTPDVTVDNRPTQRKYYAFGDVLLGFTHGDKETTKNLPLIMATEEPALWGASKFREFHLGHWHAKKETHFQPVTEQNGIRVRVIPSLCPPDAWHRSKGYESLQSAEAYLWSPKSGFAGMFSYSPTEIAPRKKGNPVEPS